MVACQGRGVVAATHAGVVSSDDAQGIRRVLAMTEDELKAIEARAELANIHDDVRGPVPFTPEVRALVAEVRRLRAMIRDAGLLEQLAEMGPMRHDDDTMK
jgi:hypothetical protein